MDCLDGSDEIKPTNVTLDKIACENIYNSVTDVCVIPDKYVCDGSEQCLYREDECQDTCSSYSYICGNDRCIVSSNVCNGVDDCGDMTDECNDGCSNTFQCNDETCLSLDRFCDGISDCSDSSDEISMTTNNTGMYR